MTEIDRPTSVIVPGIGMSHRYSYRFTRALAAHGPVLALDLSGFAGFPLSALAERRMREGELPPMSVPDYAAEVIDSIESRLRPPEAGGQLAPVVLIGHSMGTQIAAEVARLRPELVDRLVLVAPVVDPRRRTARQQGADLVKDFPREKPGGAAINMADYLRTGQRYFAAELEAMLAYRIDEAVRSIHCPVLVVRGERDPVASREWCVELAAAAPDGRFVEIPGAAHIVQHARADALADEVAAFGRIGVQ